jgi:hypothetical protein
MRRGTCDKCGSETVNAARNGINVGTTMHTGIRPHLEPDFRGMVRTHSGEAWQFVCTTCGYLEWHILDPASLEFIRGHWGAVRPH